MLQPEDNPRTFFSAERTLLSWLRTGLTIMGLGFVVARFGLFLKVLSLQLNEPLTQHQHGISALLGTLFVFFGACSILVASVQHRRFIATIHPDDIPEAYNRHAAVALTLAIGLLGLLLTAYLAFSEV